MKMTTIASDLNDALNIATRALAARPSKPILDGVMVDATGDDVVLTCSDGNLSIEVSVQANIEETGCTVIPGRLFMEMIRKLPGGNVGITTTDTKANIRCLSYRSNMSCMSAVEYPEMPEIHEQVSILLPQKRLREMISRVVFSIATDESRQLLTGCLIEITANQVWIVALDGFRMAVQTTLGEYVLPEGKDKIRYVVPGRVMNEISKILPDSEENCQMIFDGGRMQLRFGNVRLSCVLLSGEYIDYRRILPTVFSTEVKVNRDELSNAIDRASLIAREGKNNIVRLNFHDEELIVTSNAEMGDVREEMEAAITGNPLEIAFNAKYLGDVLKSITDAEIVMCFNTSVNPCVIRPVAGESFLYLILPVRVFQ